MSGSVAVHFKFDSDAEFVNLCGTWDEFASRIPLSEEEGEGKWSGKLFLAPGKYEYNYVCDGQWKYNESEPTNTDERGIVTNVVEVKAPAGAEGADAKQNLESLLAKRPEKKKVVQMNVLQDEGEASSGFAAKKKELEVQQKKDKLNAFLKRRPTRQDSHVSFVLKSHDGVADTLKKTQQDLEKKKKSDKLRQFLIDRPPKEFLHSQQILKEDKVAPGLQATQDRLRAEQLKQKMSRFLSKRPSVHESHVQKVLAGGDGVDPSPRIEEDKQARKSRSESLSQFITNRPSQEDVQKIVGS
eukprot:GFYU01001776.1.p1 GENE.GFYU01001776.1~~GFYU01001776.1.p1  ORF type:complete len:299 (-),score=120.95 GFYU01001776.1:100-996(-)